MKVLELMTRHVKSCRPGDSMSRAAEIMWACDCGVVPVVDAERHVIGMITDRDVCMAAFTRGLTLKDMRVEDAMSHAIHACHPEDPISDAQALIRSKRVRRLPVVDRAGKLVGLLSQNDIFRWAALEKHHANLGEVVMTAAACCEPRSAQRSGGKARNVEQVPARRGQMTGEPLVARQADLQC